MPDSPQTITDADLRARLSDLQSRLEAGLDAVDPHHRLTGRPVQYHVVGGHTFEIVYSEVPGIDEAEVLGVKRLVGQECYCSVTPETAETLTVRLVIPLRRVDSR